MRASHLAIFALLVISFSTVQSASLECSVCEFLVGKVEGYVASNQTENEIIAALQNDCQVFGKLSSVCDGIVAQYGPEIINLVLKKQNATVICDKIGLCDDSSAVLMLSSFLKPKAGNDTMECNLCKILLTEINDELQANKTETDVINGMYNVCSILPNDLMASCNNIVKEYGVLLIQYVSNNPAGNSCRDVGLCSAAAKHKLIGKAIKLI